MKKQLTKGLSLLVLILIIFTLPSGEFAEAATTKTIEEVVTKAGEYTYASTQAPIYGNEWQIISLVRSGFKVPSGYYEGYYNNVVTKVAEEMVKDNPFTYTTDVERIIITLSAIGKDPENVGGYNLVEYLWNKKDLGSQGLNANVFALLALDSKNYKEPAVTVNTRNSIINEILAVKTPDGGFTYSSGNADQDMTGMALQALAKYKDKPEVKATIQESLSNMSGQQRVDGGFDNAWGDNPYGTAQIMLALTELGLEPTDPANGFVKANGDLISYLFSLQVEGGSFGASGTSDPYFTPQGIYSLVGYKRFIDKSTSLFNMTDVLNNTDYSNNLKAVNDGIATLVNMDKLSLDDKETVKLLLSKYTELPADYKVQVIDLDKLNIINVEISKLEAIVKSINDDIFNKINPIKTNLDNKADIVDIISRVESLSENDKKYVVDYEYVLEAKAIIDELENKNQIKSEEIIITPSAESTKTGDESTSAIFIIALALAGIIVISSKKKVA